MSQAAALQSQPPAERSSISLALSDIKLHHSVFALPFAILAAFLALPTNPNWNRVAGQLALIIAAMFFARTWAMLVNRIADRRIDADNPRTAKRPLASGALSLRTATATTLTSAAAFILCCAGFLFFFDNPWPLMLSAPTLLWIAFYSFTKRFTALCHIFLGGALATSPLAAAIAIDPAALTSTSSIWYLAAMVLCWVAGFDILYALQDLNFDRKTKLHSIPAALGSNGAAMVSRTLHLIAIAMLALAAINDDRLGTLFLVATIIVIALLITEHVILIKRGLAGLPMAFFTINGIVSLLLGAAGSLDTFI